MDNADTSGGMTLRPVGIVRNNIKEAFLTAGKDGIKMERKKDEAIAEYHRSQRDVSEIVIDGEWAELLTGIEEYSHLVVLYWAHGIPAKSRSLRQVHPMGRKELPLVGIFCTRSPARPNPVLLSVVKLVEREGNVLRVTGLDAMDGSPVIDIKPYIREFYPQEEMTVPDWMKLILGEVDRLTQ